MFSKFRISEGDAICFFHLLFVCLIFFSSSNPLSPDEAHYVEWSKQLDFSYYSKGPMLALLIYVSTYFFGFSEHAVRLPALFFTLASFLFAYCFLKQKFNPKERIISYLVIISSVAFLYPALLITTDAPILFFWISSVYYLSRYLENRVSFVDLLIGLILLGFGIWTKYTILVVPVVLFLLLVVDVKSKARLVQECLLIFLIITLFLSPILYWNYLHGWVNLSHNASHASSGISKGIKLAYFFDFIGSQLGVFGLFFVLVIYNVLIQVKNKKILHSLPILSSLLLFAICFFVSLTKRIYPNWTISAFFTLLLYHTPYLVNLFFNKRKLYFFGLALNFFITILGVFLILGFTFGVRGNLLPIKKLVAWPEFASKVREISKLYPETKLIITDSYDIMSELGYYAPELLVYNASLGGRRMNQYDIWQKNIENLKGLREGNALLILGNEKNLELFRDYFNEIRVINPLPYYYKDLNGSKLRNLNSFIASGYNNKLFPLPYSR